MRGVMRSEPKIMIHKIIALCLGLLTASFLLIAEASAAETNAVPSSAAPVNRVETAPYFGFEKALYFNASCTAITSCMRISCSTARARRLALMDCPLAGISSI
jgi:hypothetical protein